MNTENNYRETDLGNVSPNPRGEYVSGTKYEYLDLVTMEGGSYICLTELGTTTTEAPEPGKTTEFWQCMTLPGDLTPEYVSMHDRVVNLSEQVEADAEEVRAAEQNVSGMEENITQMHEQTRQSAEDAERSKDSAAGYATSADASRRAAEESEQNVNAQLTGFDAHVAEKISEAKNDIEAARITANKAMLVQQEQSVNEVTRVGNKAISTAQAAAQAATEKASSADISEQNAKASETAAKESETNVAQMAEQVATDKEQVASNRTAVENAKQEMTESAAQIQKNTDDITELKGDLTDKADRASLARTDRSLDALWKLNQGISYQFEQDNTESYQKIVHSGAKLASVEQIGGKTVVWNHLLKNGNFNGYNYWIARSSTLSTNNNELVCETSGYYGGFTSDPSNANTFAGHKYFAAIDVLGTSGITVYWPYFDDDIFGMLNSNMCTGEYQHCIGIYTAKATGCSLFGIRLDTNGALKATIKAKNAMMIDLTSMFGFGNEPTTTDDPRITWIEQYAAEHSEYNAGALVSADVESVKYNDTVVSEIPEAVRNLPGYGWSAGDVRNSFERTDTGWQYVQRVGEREYQDGDSVTDGVTSLYVLGNPVITDISDLMADFQAYFEVEAGGSITMENAAKLPVPSSVEYLISLAEVNG